jgi:hypothetical protein
MEDLCENPRKLIHKELQSQDLRTFAYEDVQNQAGTSIKHSPRNCSLSQQILKKPMKH